MFNHALSRLIIAVDRNSRRQRGEIGDTVRVSVDDLRRLLDDWNRLDKVVRTNAAYEHGGKVQVVDLAGCIKLKDAL